MRLNNKGYLIVEVIVASVLAFGLAYFLLELVVDLKNKNEDYYVNTLLETDKALMTREVMNDISNYKIKGITTNNTDYVEFTLYTDKIELKKRITIEDNTFKYGMYDGREYIMESDYFEKKFANELNVTGITMTNNCYYDTGFSQCKELRDPSMSNVTNGLITISIDAKTAYSDYNYGVELNINYNVKSVSIEIQEYNYGVEDEEYKTGDTIEWCGYKWYVLNDSSISSNKVELILANNYKTGMYGFGVDYKNSEIYNAFLGNDSSSFINLECISSAKSEGTLLKDEGVGEYIRLANKDELTGKIPNDSKTPFWTMTSKDDKIYVGDSKGTILKDVFKNGIKGTYDLYANDYSEYYKHLSCTSMGGYYVCETSWIEGNANVNVIAPANEWYSEISTDNNEILLSPQDAIVEYSGEYKEGYACKNKESFTFYPCTEKSTLSTDVFNFVSSDFLEYYNSPSSSEICYNNNGVGALTTMYYASSKRECEYHNKDSDTGYRATDPVKYYAPLSEVSEYDIGYRPVVNVLKKGR